MVRNCLFFFSLLLFSCSAKKINTSTPAPKNAITVMTYNIHHANPPSKASAGTIDVEAIAAVINQQKPDVVALQEVDVNTKRAGMNEAVILAEKTKMNFYFARAIDFDGGQYGVAILSKYGLAGGTTYPLPTLAGTNGEPRVLATAVVEVNSQKITIACTHLDAQRNDTNRVLQIRAITDILQKESNPVILSGDLNATPGGSVINTLDQYFTRSCVTDCGFTIPQVNPTKTIDFISYKPAARFSVTAHTVINEPYASDHLPVIATLQLK